MMNKNLRDFSCEKTGKILGKDKRKVYDKKNPWYGNDYFHLRIVSEEERAREYLLFVYFNLVSPEIIQEIEQSKYVDKRYLFFCEKKRRGLVLNNWRELSNNLGSFDQEQILESHD